MRAGHIGYHDRAFDPVRPSGFFTIVAAGERDSLPVVGSVSSRARVVRSVGDSRSVSVRSAATSGGAGTTVTGELVQLTDGESESP
jgi:hypothetical protein